MAKLLDSSGTGAAGRSALSAAFAAPPTSTAQVLRPGAYLAGEAGGVSVRDPQNYGTLADADSLGQVQLALPVSRGRSYTNVSTTGQWRGDRYDTIRHGNRNCVRDTAYLSDSTARDQLTTDLRGVGVQVTSSPIDASLTLNRCG